MDLRLDDRDYAHSFFEDYDLGAQLIAIRSFLAHSQRSEEEESAEIRALAEDARKDGGDHLVGMYTDMIHASVYSGAAHSAAAVGMLAPFVENLFTGIFRGLGEQEGDFLGRDSASKRSRIAREHFWDPHFAYASGEVKANLTEGIMQLADATRLTPRLPNDTRKVLEALLGYRNAMLHNGFEWPAQRRRSFGDSVRNWNTDWFICAWTNEKPWVWYLSDLFIDRILVFIDEVIEAVGRHVRETYYPDQPAS